jgi:FtsP/CotA-like multicopper oxidase with cupredoxin domain
MLCAGALSPAVSGLAQPAKVLAEDPVGTPVPAQAAPVTPKAASFGPPTSATDESRVPHYYGPYANWAWSPQALADAIITMQRAPGDTTGSGAEATATVDPKDGAITAIAVTSPGSGYTLPPIVAITSPGITPTSAATASSRISAGVVTSVTINETGGGFTAPAITISGGSPTPGFAAEAIARGSVDSVAIVDGGTSYQAQPIVVFSLPDLPDGVQATGAATMVNGAVAEITLVNPGSGYTAAPTITVLDGEKAIATAANIKATIRVDSIEITSGGQGYHAVPTVTIADTVGLADKGSSATAVVAVLGAVTGITVTKRGAGYITPGIKKFQDTLAGVGSENANNLGQFIPVAIPDTTTYPGSDYYEIAVVQYRMQFSSSMPATLLRGYVQLSTSVVPGDQVPLSNENFDPSKPATPIYLPNGARAYGVSAPHYLGPMVVASKDRAVRVLFRDLLPTGVDGDLFLPVDTTLMGSGMGPDMVALDANNVPIDGAADASSVLDGIRNPECGLVPKPMGCYTENRATLHLHGGITPWISDGTPHQWITPAGEDTIYPKGVSVSNVPDMPDPGPGAQTFFYTNQQGARLLWIHDHTYGITRLNVYAGEAMGYLLTDATEQKLLATGGALEGLGAGTPLIVQDKTFVSDRILTTDPTYQAKRWGGTGSLWVPHVYMPGQNPNSPTGTSSFGRWMYGPWFWPPSTNQRYQPIPNPYYDATCDSQTADFCEPQVIPSTPNVSVGMEAFNDTPIVNGTAYPTTTVDPKSYRFRILNAANDRFWNLQWYVADPTTGTLSEVALKKDQLAAAQIDPNVYPTPDTTLSPAGPSWIQIGNEGGFLPTPTVVANQPITWITDPTRFDWGNVDKHSLLLAPAERADVIVDFSAYRGKTLILYNDAPAAFPARQASYDYYTGNPDMQPAGAPSTLPGYGPNTRTIMQVKVSDTLPAVAFDRPNTTNDRMGALMAAFAHHSDGSGVFESGSNPIIVGQAAYNTTYGTNFAASGWCNALSNPASVCDGYARIHEQTGDPFKFDTLAGVRVTVPFTSKAMHDEMNSADFDEFGRMTANLGVEAPSANPGNQTVVLFPYVNPVTEAFDASDMPSSLDVTPITSGADGTQIWKITHNGVDTHPIHFHLYDVQVLNRVTWDNIILPPEPNELGWKETVRISPLEDTIIAIRPIVPTLPFAVPDSVRPLNPAMPIGATGSTNTKGYEAGFNNLDITGTATPANIVNAVTDFGWEYVWHCHILGHEEMDMMRPVSVKVPSEVPQAPVLGAGSGGSTITWIDGTPIDYAVLATWGSRRNEVGFRVERAVVTDGVPGAWAKVADVPANRTTYQDVPPDPALMYGYRVVSWNQAGTATSTEIQIPGAAPDPLGTTSAGTNVTVIPVDPGTGASPLWVTFGNVSVAGTTSISTAAAGPAPTGFTLGSPPTYVDVTTTATYAGTMTICLRYAGISFGGSAPALYHYAGGVWTDVTTSIDTVAQIICGQTTSLSPFTLGVAMELPGAPRSPRAVAGSLAATVLWLPPTSNGNSPITGYTVTAAPDGATCTTTGALSCVVTGLQNSVAYSFTVTATTLAGTGPASAASVAVTPSLNAPPVASIGQLGAVALGSTVAVSWSAIAGANRVVSYDVRYRRASATGGFGSYVSWKHKVAGTHSALPVTAGGTYCVSVQARDSVGHLSAWTAPTCTATPLDDRSMWRGRGWIAGRGTGYYKSTYLKAWEFGATLTRGQVKAKQISIVATTCKTCGVVRVYWGTKLLATVNLYSATTVKRKIIPITTFSSVRTGTLKLRSWSDDRWVIIDGVVISRT